MGGSPRLTNRYRDHHPMRLPAALLLLLAACAAPPRPNVVVVLVDDLGYRDLSCQGSEDLHTPHLDALAASGVRLSQGYVSHPYCSPSRAGLLTGRYQQRFGHEHNPRYDESDDETGTDVATTMLPALLADSGYATAHIGKWHVGAGAPFRPLARGYDEFFGFLGGGHDYFSADGETEYLGRLWRGAAPTGQGITYLTDDLTDEALAFVERNAGTPFFLLLAYNAPHAPDQVSAEHLLPVAHIPDANRRLYAGLVQGIDVGVGRLVAHLEALGLRDDTLIVFLSDNGGRRSVADNRPLRGNKGWLHEGGLRVPFLWSWPGHLPEGTTYDAPLSALDVLPTALSLAGVPLPANLDGLDVFPHLTGARREPARETLHWRVCGGAGYAIRRGDWKLVHDVSMPAPALYDLARDVGEDHDLAATHPGLVQELRALHEAWSAELEAPRWTEQHARNVTEERAAAHEAGTRQYPMTWLPD